ncbi:MAG TPA: glucosaminidase domain-containing protein [Pseudomonadales bacterium]|jgi:Bax protein|nr:hypothetical protein [Gammaproteobacteria bacterium]MDP6024377.1 glucosaminidase domain-containing protein [Pseudomonadales bacterium]MDP6316574.1 glucosaminidase domain-containing protein [Pseudomonadales bacterium]MDP7315207.1 glucosaminidase domain-containing protein [Pseudomonadales bacterium]MDP7576564.1 glucosaminidase domain-containing protein [Pseudomonadales bacterium]|tara:strand:- start:1074 stop:1868 length:795 start_codon:yes stop_codon:yes gene_type:complete
MKWKEFLIVPLLTITIAAIALFHYQFERQLTPLEPTFERPPDFKSYSNVKQKKLDFFSFMLPLVRNANKSVHEDRKFLLGIQEVKGTLSSSNKVKLKGLLRKYNLNDGGEVIQQVDELLNRADIVPASLILAQSANESAWGTSRFATDANNFFGIWCFSLGCGLTPRNRDEGLHHEVAKFESIQAGVIHYVHTINTHSAYQNLRNMRSQERQANQPLSGIKLANGLVRYSEWGLAYVQEIQAMIRYNELQHYNLEDTAVDQSAE